MDQLDLNVTLNSTQNSIKPTYFHSQQETEDLTNLAKSLVDRGQMLEARKVYQFLLHQNPSYENGLKFVKILFDSQDWLECLRTIDFTLSMRGQQLQGLHDLFRVQGCCFTQIGNWEKAEDSFYSSLEYPGAVDVVLVNLGTLDIQRKQWETATRSFREAVKINSDNDKGWVGLALCHRFKGDHQLCLANLEKALDINALNETAIGLLLSWYTESASDVIYERLKAYVLAEGTEPQLWLGFVEAARRNGHLNVAKLELERLRLTHTDFLPAFQYRL